MSLTEIKGHSTALVEAHKMCINKDMKLAIARPTKAYLHLRYRIAAHKHLLKQVYLPPESGTQCEDTLFTTNKKTHVNVCVMAQTVKDFNLSPHNIASNCAIINVVSGIRVSLSQRHNLLSDTIGDIYLEQKVKDSPGDLRPD